MTVLTERITPTAVQRLAATLNWDPEPFVDGALLPLGWHSVFGATVPKSSELSEDGLASVSDVPDQPGLPRRVFGGSRVTFHAPLRIGEELTVTSDVIEVKPKGPNMTIVAVRQSFSAGGTVRVVEEQDLVHLAARSGDEKTPPGKPAPTEADFSATVEPSPVMLFRYSALTFNSHRVHYDFPYAKEREGLPALLVQGRLLSVLTMGLLTQHGLAERTKRFAYRSVRPVFADRPFHLGAHKGAGSGPMSMWVADADRSLALTATVEFD